MIGNIFNLFKLCIGWRLLCLVFTFILSIIVLYQAILLLFFTIKINAMLLLIEYIAFLWCGCYSIFGY